MQGTGESKSVGGASPLSMGIGLPSGLRPMMMRGENEKGQKGSTRKKLPTPKEMVAHYESQGMQTQDAYLKVIDDLQNILLRVVTTSKKSNMDAINARLVRLESKLDSKPGYPQTLAIGIASGAVSHVFPQVAKSVIHIWNIVRSSTTSQ